MSEENKTPEYVLPGKTGETGYRTFSPLDVTARVTSIRLSETRDEGSEIKVKVDPADVVAVELDDGFTLWIRGDDLRRELGEEARDGGLTLRPRLGGGDSQRGVAGWVLKGLKIFGFDPVEGLVSATAKAVEPEGGNLVLQLDPGVPRPWVPEAWRPVEGPLPPGSDDAPLLILLHGTFSSTLGSFGELIKAPGPAAALQAGYPGRIYGFEHRTLTESPIANALALAKRLPADARLHLVSHSRGGLVGDLLCLAPLISETSLLSPKDLARFPADDQRDLPQLLEELRRKRPRVERFVRVASPSRGTTLASGRLDRWLSVVSHLISKLPILSNAVGEAVIELILAVVKKPKDAESLPGLAAMMPGSPLVALLNRPDLRIWDESELAVISGDIEEAGPWSRLKLLLPDLFFAGDHDLVVNTGSMYGGVRRTRGWYCFDQGADVNHFNYFGIPAQADEGGGAAAQPITVDALLLGLRGTLPGRLYQPLAEAPVIAPARSARGVSGRRPVLFVLPGVMGSSLAVRDLSEEVWLSLGRIALGQLERLRMDQPLAIKPTGLLGLAYGDLLDFLDRSHDVLPFPFDWRRSVREAAALLAEEVDRALERAEAGNQPVRILAHSMGGLVARAMIAERPELWQRILALGGRLVMLGTPNRGSWEIVRLLVSQAATLKQLALLDVTNDRAELLEIIRDFPGVLELLPDDPRDFFSAGIWHRLRAHDEERWGLPGQGRPEASAPSWLEQARTARAWLRDRAVDPQGMVYVAGQAPATPSDVEETVDRRWMLPDRRRLRFFVSQRGDSSVLWDDGLLPGVPTWYAPGIGHGDLVNERTLFPAIEDLLEQGRTEAKTLQREEPVSRGTDVRRELVDREPAYYPDEAMLVRTALGIGRAPSRAPARRAVRVSVTHGSLAFAEHRVAVGHYEGDTIIGAEAYLDRVLGGRLSARQALGLYPGPAGSHALFDHPSPSGKPPGALVVGLGEVGGLTPSLLSATFARALLELARQIVEGGDPAGGPHRIAISSLLIGTGAGGISVQDSVLAILRGVFEANSTLDQAGQADSVHIATLELVELWEDRAISAARAFAQIDQDPELAGGFEVTELVRQGTGGNRGVRASGQDQEWWHRLQVLGDERGALRFTLLTQRARAEETLVPTQAELVDRFVARASAATAYDPDVNRTLFEMLLPNRLKDGSVLRSNLVLVLDKEAARFPWEMLEDRWSQPLPGQRATTRSERSDGRKPGAVEFGMLRQLKTPSYRAEPIMSLGRSALVIGDPRSDFVPLPGARDEARRVAGQLVQSGYRVTQLIEPRDEEVMVALHADAYQILHLAGHGVHHHLLESRAQRRCDACGQPLAGTVQEPDLVSGMIIGEGMVLTPGDVEKMRRVPELVFLNCCHLGSLDGTRKDSDRDQPHRLAANLAAQFIEMGVRAVIAAGWAVNDRAALTFADAFYRQMAAGRRFGDAVRLAREQTWQEHRAFNTWGAYQCYGDPDFSLGGGGRRGQGPAAIVYVCPAEVVADLDNLLADAQTASPARIAQLRERLQRIEQTLERVADKSGDDWRERGDVAEALGLAQGELGRFEDAVRNLDRAIRAVDARATWFAIERRARYQARCAKALHFSGEDRAKQAAQRLFEVALKSLSDLERDPEGRLTVERYRSLTGIHWRRVQTLPAAEREAELEQLVSVFERAAEQLSRGCGDPLDPYGRLLWLTGKLMLTAYSTLRRGDVCPTFDEWCTELERRALQYELEYPSASADAIKLEVHMLRLVEEGALLEERAEELVAQLRGILARGVSHRQLSSILDFVELLQVLSEGATHKKRRFHPQAASLARIGDALRAWQDGG